MTRRQVLASAGAAALASGLAKPAIAAKEPILIGYLPALTGPSSSTGVGINRGIQLAVQEINAAGGVDGRQLELITRDTQSDPFGSRWSASVLRLVRHGPSGPVKSSQTAIQAAALNISPSASTLTTDLASVVSAASVAFSSFSVASRSATASGNPSSSAHVRSVP